MAAEGPVRGWRLNGAEEAVTRSRGWVKTLVFLDLIFWAIQLLLVVVVGIVLGLCVLSLVASLVAPQEMEKSRKLRFTEPEMAVVKVGAIWFGLIGETGFYLGCLKCVLELVLLQGLYKATDPRTPVHVAFDHANRYQIYGLIVMGFTVFLMYAGLIKVVGLGLPCLILRVLGAFIVLQFMEDLQRWTRMQG